VLDEHAAIRAKLLDMGTDLDLHLISAERVETFVQQLRAHALREEQALYAWTSHNMHADGRKMLARALRVRRRR
jgi:predicted metal-dependent HD superfamily phosphohydrolase